MEQQPPAEAEQGEVFTRLLVANQPRIYGFIFSLVHDRTATEDILQDVSTVLWVKFDRFEPGTDFAAWAMSIARLTVLNWRRRQKKLPLSLDDEQFVRLADEVVAVSCEFEDRRRALANCLEDVSVENRQLLAQRYEMNQSVASIAERVGRSRVTVHKRLTRLHTLLLDCINGQVGPEVS